MLLAKLLARRPVSEPYPRVTRDPGSVGTALFARSSLTMSNFRETAALNVR